MWKFIGECLKMHPRSKIQDSYHSLTYDVLFELAEAHGSTLNKIIGNKAKCAVLCDSGLNTAIGILACWRAGVVAIPLSKNYGQNHCEQIISLTKPDIVITDNDNYKYKLTYNINLFQIKGNAENSLPISDELSDVALIMCTSGTTGKPKGAIITEYGLQENVKSIGCYFDISDNDTILIARPLYHCAVLTGEFLVSLLKGTNILFFDAVYSPMNVISFAEKNHVTTLCGTPTLLNHISQFMKRSIGKTSINKIALSGECLKKDVALQIREAFPCADIYNVYGLTEASPRVAYLPPDKYDYFPESVGIPINGVSIKIVDIVTGDEMPLNAHGTVMVSSPSIMKGYYNNHDLTEETIQNNWLNTHDIGYKDENGYLYILSRSDDMIIKAGMNIYPKEIENAIDSLPEISECIAYGRKNAQGETISVDIVMNSNYINVDKKSMMLRFQEILPSYLMPTEINVVKSLPRNASGKIIRRKVGYS